MGLRSHWARVTQSNMRNTQEIKQPLESDHPRRPALNVIFGLCRRQSGDQHKVLSYKSVFGNVPNRAPFCTLPKEYEHKLLVQNLI